MATAERLRTALYDDFAADLVRRVGELVAGDPTDEQTDVGPLIDDGAAERVEAWVEEAVAGGAKLLAGGKREGRMWEATMLADAKEEMRISCEEAFAPLVVLYRYDDVSQAIEEMTELKLLTFNTAPL